ncbi:sugar transporter [Cucurbitaria berberidis CBS 394.84]|uniref:Sugar transporter n=1 Tax=Cucurbitaria berberidis CBS 394.84 TaxID=1168544 RepID=A0A9P4GHR4_9PLEO|nr:sugar transporter [Cucurbitaria berberidis CBS 394.84]KAF1845867.1 sugar transporter [Cucurbitaria berberidis CBS 394.84]
MAITQEDEKHVSAEHREASSDGDAGFLHTGKEATEFEQNLTLRDALKYYPWSIFWSIMFSAAIIMEGYDIVLIGNLMAQPAFQKRYGGWFGEKLGWQITGPWQVGMGCATGIGTIIGAFANGWLTEKFGYRRTLLVAVTSVAGFIFITFFAQSLPMLMTGQVLCGLPWGVFATMAPAYASEVCPIKLRGYLANYVCLCWALGQLMAAGVLTSFSSNTTQWAYRIPFAIQWVWPIPLFLILWFAPESPYWLARKGRLEEAENTLRRLTSKNFPLDHSKLLAMVVHTNRVEDESGTGTTYLDCFKGTNLRRTEIVCFVFIAQNTTGVTIGGTPTYFFVQAGVSAAESFKFATGALGLASVGVLISWYLITRFGRRTLYVWSSLALTILLLIIGVIATVSQSPGASFAQAGMVLAWEVIFYSTIGPVCYAIIGEIPAVSVRSKSICLSRIAYYISQIINMVSYPYMINPTEGDWKGKVGYFYAGLAFLTFLWAFFRLPETKDRSFAEIDYLFTSKVRTRQFSKTKVDTFDPIEEHRVQPLSKDVEQ